MPKFRILFNNFDKKFKIYQEFLFLYIFFFLVSSGISNKNTFFFVFELKKQHFHRDFISNFDCYYNK
jgi:hypothetical protein